MLDRLSKAITDAGIPLERVEGIAGNPVLIFQAIATQAQRDAAAAIVAGFDWSPAADAAWRLTIQLAQDSATLDGPPSPVVRVERAIVALLIDELNDLRQWIMDFKAAVAASTSLADYKTRVAALDNLPQRTAAQARAAISNQIGSGGVES